MRESFLILGAGFTGSRVAARLMERGHRVQATSGRPETFADWAHIAPGTRVLYAIPPDEWEAERLRRLEGAASKVVYLSSTGVYGAQKDVNELTQPKPRTEREWARVRAEAAVESGGWDRLILRPAAIYGPGRGVHVSLQRGEFPLVEGGTNFVSRIHVDDLAAICAEALESELTGAWPVADEEPCRSVEITEFCCALLGLPLPPEVPRDQVSETRRADRRVDGRAICRALNVRLAYPTYRLGIPACLAEERSGSAA